MKISFFLLLLFFLEAQLTEGQSLIVLKDNVNFSFSDESQLNLLTDNPDSLNPFFENPCPAPCCPTMQCYSIMITNYDTSNVQVAFKNYEGTEMGTFNWIKLSAGIYKFDWWKDCSFEKSGVYLAETIAKNFSKTTKIIYVK